jgi:DNA modification methylase
VADAIRDCSNRNGIILDPFGGAGTTLVAAEKTARRARLIEIDPRYVDIAILRWQRLTGRTARNATTDVPFPMTGVTAAPSQSVSSNSSGRTSS